MSKMLIGDIKNLTKTPVKGTQVCDGNDVATIHVYSDEDVIVEWYDTLFEYKLFMELEIVPIGLKRKVKFMVFKLTGKDKYLK